MGTCITDGENEIGVALTNSWAAVWTVDTPYISILRRDFWDEHADEIKAAAEKGRDFTDEDGQTGSVHAISTNGDLDPDGFPKNFSDASEYVADELTSWARSDGGSYERAVIEGYSY